MAAMLDSILNHHGSRGRPDRLGQLGHVRAGRARVRRRGDQRRAAADGRGRHLVLRRVGRLRLVGLRALQHHRPRGRRPGGAALRHRRGRHQPQPDLVAQRDRLGRARPVGRRRRRRRLDQLHQAHVAGRQPASSAPASRAGAAAAAARRTTAARCPTWPSTPIPTPATSSTAPTGSCSCVRVEGVRRHVGGGAADGGLHRRRQHLQPRPWRQAHRVRQPVPLPRVRRRPRDVQRHHGRATTTSTAARRSGPRSATTSPPASGRWMPARWRPTWPRTRAARS